MKKVLLLTALLSLILAVPAEAKKSRVKPVNIKAPAGTKFYSPPKKLYLGSPGSLVWQRPSTGLTRISGAATNRHILYRSRSLTGKPIVVSGTLSIPKGRPPVGGWPIISWAHGTTGIADKCAPSWENGNLANDYGNSEANKILFRQWLAAGYAIARTDYEGLGTPGPHPYLVGRSAARSLVDIVPAARQLAARLKSPISKKVTLIGHSQGGHAVLFGASLFNQYNKTGLSLEKTITYAPASHLAEQATILRYAGETTPGFGSPSSLSALATLIVLGAASDNSAIKPTEILSEQAIPFLPETEKVCLPQLGESDSLGGIAPYTLIKKDVNLDSLFTTLEAMNPDLSMSGSPVLMVQGLDDTTVQPIFTNLLSNELNRRGVNLTYQTFPGSDHGSILINASGVVNNFLIN